MSVDSSGRHRRCLGVSGRTSTETKHAPQGQVDPRGVTRTEDLTDERATHQASTNGRNNNDIETQAKVADRRSGGRAVHASLLAFFTVPSANQAAKFQSHQQQETAGYTITNNSGKYSCAKALVATSVPPTSRGAWLPGQTLNFEVDSGTWSWERFTGDAYSEAYTVGGTNNGTDAGTVDGHFNTGPGGYEEPLAYLNPADTAPLVASSVGFTPVSAKGETWTMISGGDNRIVSSGSVSFTVDSEGRFGGVTAQQFRTSVTTAKDGNCTSPTSTLTNCLLGNTSWSFNWG